MTDLSDFFIYDPDTGIVRHNPDRPRDTFPTDIGYKRWKSRCSGKITGSKRGGGYLGINMKSMGVSFSIHRIALMLSGIEIPEGYEVDHIDGCKTNNKLENLRVVTRAVNAKNRALQQNNKSGAVGVHWCKTAEKWRATIKVSRIKIHLGSFEDKEEAIEARKEAEIKYGFHENHGRIGEQYD